MWVIVKWIKKTTGFAAGEDLRLLILMKRNQNGRDFERTSFDFDRLWVCKIYGFSFFIYQNFDLVI